MTAVETAQLLLQSSSYTMNIAYQGNTSAASIPLAIEALLESGEAKTGQTCLIIGFGAGLVYAGQVIVLP